MVNSENVNEPETALVQGLRPAKCSQTMVFVVDRRKHLQRFLTLDRDRDSLTRTFFTDHYEKPSNIVQTLSRFVTLIAAQSMSTVLSTLVVKIGETVATAHFNVVERLVTQVVIKCD